MIKDIFHPKVFFQAIDQGKKLILRYQWQRDSIDNDLGAERLNTKSWMQEIYEPWAEVYMKLDVGIDETKLFYQSIKKYIP